MTTAKLEPGDIVTLHKPYYRGRIGRIAKLEGKHAYVELALRDRNLKVPKDQLSLHQKGG